MNQVFLVAPEDLTARIRQAKPLDKIVDTRPKDQSPATDVDRLEISGSNKLVELGFANP